MEKYGIDKITICNFDIETDQNFLLQKEKKENKTTEKMIIKDKQYNLVSTCSTFYNENGSKELKDNFIQFNPNIILHRNNIDNSSISDLLESINRIKKILKKRGVNINFNNAKIRSIEININIPVDFSEYVDVFKLFIRQFKNAGVYGKFTDSMILNEFIEDETFYAKVGNFTEFKIYNKAKESKLTTPISRMEYSFKANIIDRFMQKKGLENTLRDFCLDEGILESIFLYKAKKQFLSKMFIYIDKKIKPQLEYEYLSFKSVNKLASISGRKTKRDIYSHLTKSWIFDYSFLLDLIKKYDYKHYAREKNKIFENYKKYDGLKKLEKITDYIFPPYYN